MFFFSLRNIRKFCFIIQAVPVLVLCMYQICVQGVKVASLIQMKLCVSVGCHLYSDAKAVTCPDPSESLMHT